MRAPARSQLLSAAAATSVAAVMVATPAGSAPAPRLFVPASLPVALAGLDSPLSELLLTVRVVNNDLFNGQEVFGDYPWQPFQGTVPQFIYTALPAVSQLGYNGSRYLGQSVDAVASAGYILSEAAWNLPGAAVTATRQLLSGDVAGAITTLKNAIAVPIQNAGTIALEAGKAVAASVSADIVSVAATVPGIVRGLVDTTAGSVKALIAAAAAIVTDAVKALGQRDFSGAWNAVVDGLLGPVGSDGLVTSSVAGTMEAVSIGPGLGPQGYPDGYRLPSFRMWAERSQLTVADAIGAGYPTAETVPVAARRTRRAHPAAAADQKAASPAATDSGSTGATARRARPASNRTGLKP